MVGAALFRILKHGRFNPEYTHIRHQIEFLFFYEAVRWAMLLLLVAQMLRR